MSLRYLDGSLVVGEVVQRSAVQGAIPWLLLRARSTDGSGVFKNVKYIQRVDTVGGVALGTGTVLALALLIDLVPAALRWFSSWRAVQGAS